MKAKILLSFFSVCLCLITVAGIASPPPTVMGLKSPTENFSDYVKDYQIVADESAKVDLLISELNQARLNPSAYGKQIGVDLSAYSAKPALIKSTLLCKVASIKARDMQQNDYFGHTDKWGYGLNHWVTQAGFPVIEQIRKHPNRSFLESCNYNTDLQDSAIKDLITDDLEPSLGHRKHLLSALHEDFPPDTHVGIGIAGPNTVVIVTSQK